MDSKVLFLFSIILISFPGRAFMNDEVDDIDAKVLDSQFKEMFGFNVGKFVRTAWAAAQPKILIMAEHPRFENLIQELVDVNPCVKSLEAYIVFLEQRVEMIEENSPLIESTVTDLIAMRGQRNLTTLTSGSADILIKLDKLMPLVLHSCNHDPEVGVAALQDLALNLHRQSLVSEDIPGLTNSEFRHRMTIAAQIVETLAGVVEQFSINLAAVDCYTSDDYLGDFIKLASRTVEDIGQALGALGMYSQAKEIRQYAAFVLSFRDSMAVLPEFKMPGDCAPGVLGRYAVIFKEFANILADVGLGALYRDLGISFRLDLLP